MVHLEVGDRVRFTGFKVPDQWADLALGIEGTVELLLLCYPNLPVHVKWDNGCRLGHRWDEVQKITKRGGLGLKIPWGRTKR